MSPAEGREIHHPKISQHLWLKQQRRRPEEQSRNVVEIFGADGLWKQLEGLKPLFSGE
jgi:hypothetical protein